METRKNTICDTCGFVTCECRTKDIKELDNLSMEELHQQIAINKSIVTRHKDLLETLELELLSRTIPQKSPKPRITHQGEDYCKAIVDNMEYELPLIVVDIVKSFGGIIEEE